MCCDVVASVQSVFKRPDSVREERRGSSFELYQAQG